MEKKPEEGPRAGSGSGSAAVREGAAPVPPASQGMSRHGVMLVLGALMVSMLMGSLDQTIVSTALPTIVGDLGGADHMLWVTTAFLLSSTAVMPIWGKLGDTVGRKYLFCGCVALFVLGSLLCSVATSMPMLIVGRAVQGLGGGGQMVLSQAIVADLFPPRERGKYMGIMGAVFGVSAVVGPLLGGVFTDLASWRMCFWINIPLGVLTFIPAALFLPHRRRTRWARGAFDLPGSVLMLVATVCFVLGISWGGTLFAWGSPVVVGLFVVAIAAAAAFVIVESRAADPVIPLGFFKNRNYLVCTVAGLFIMLGMMGVLAYLPTYLQIVDGLGAIAAGYMTLPMLLSITVASTASGFIASRVGRAKFMPVVGSALAAVAFLLLSLLTVDSSLLYLGVSLFMLGLGIGIGQQMLVLIVQNEFDVSLVGTVTATNNFFREIGATLGASLVGSLFTANLATQLAEKLDPLGGMAALGVAADDLTPALVRGLDETVRLAVENAYNDALAPVFLCIAPLLALTFVLLLVFVKDRPLASTREGSGHMG